MAITILFLTALPLLAQYERDLQYQQHGDHWEGFKPKPVSGYDIELLSALVNYREPGPSWPQTLRLKFYLPPAKPVDINVRLPRPKTVYYWLDNVKPSKPWRRGAFNEFSWSTQPVLRNLTAETPDDLGVVVRLSDKGPAKSEPIAPAALFHQQPPKAVNGYRFTFKTNGGAHLTCKIYRGNKEIYQRPQNWEHAGSPFTVSWSTQGQPEGPYRLEVSGYYDDNTPVAKELIFEHRAVWK